MENTEEINANEKEQEDPIEDIIKNQNDEFTLDLSNKEIYEMRSILDKIKTGKLPFLTYLDISRNKLMDINLQGIKTLMTLKASKNCLQSANLDLLELQYLDLSSNNLENIPKLTEMNKLEVVLLQKNKINKFEHGLLPMLISNLDISDNKIEVPIDNFSNFIEGFKRFILLEELNIEKNEFNNSYPNYETKIEVVCQQLKIINYNKVDRILLEEQRENREAEQKIIIKKVDSELPTLKLLTECIEEARKYPPSCQLKLEYFAKATQTLSKFASKAYIDQEFSEVTSIKEFFEQVDLLHLSQPKFRKEICVGLARLSSLNVIGDFSMEQLTKFMKSSSLIAAEILPILSRVIVKGLTFVEEIKDIPENILERLCKMSKEQDISSILTPLIPKMACFIGQKEEFSDKKKLHMVLGIIAAGIKGKKENVALLFGKKVKYDPELEQSFLGNLRKFLKKPILSKIEYSQKIYEEQQQYLYVLQIIEFCSKHDRDSAHLCCIQFYNDLMCTIVETINDYKGLNSMRQDQLKSQYSLVVCEIFSAELNAFAGIFYTSVDEDIHAILKHSNNKVIGKILSLVSLACIDPKVLTSICRLALAVFQAPTIMNDAELMKDYIEKMNNIAPILEFLGGSRWGDLCKEGSKYNSSISKTQNGLMLQDIKQQFLFDTIASIVNVINFISGENGHTKCPSFSLFEEVNQACDNCGRVEILFNLLKVNSDDVRLAVVECLCNTELKHFKTAEIGRMVLLLGAYKNPTAGKTEIVLGKLLWVFSKMVMEEIEDVGEEFRKSQAKLAIKDCLEVLVRNQMRLVEDEEEEEKVFLSSSCIYFLKCCSKYSNLAKILSESTKEYVLLLKTDEDAEKHSNTSIPIEVEKTALGSTVHSILAVFLSNNTLDQYSSVCFRVISTLADVLSCNNNYTIPNIFQKYNEDEVQIKKDPIELIKDDLTESIKKREKEEEENWIDIYDAWERLSSLGDKKIELETQIKAFVDTGLLEILLNYLYGNCSHRCNLDLVKYIEGFSGNKIQNLQLTLKMIRQVRDIREEYIEKQKELKEEAKDCKNVDGSQKTPPRIIILSELLKEQLAFDKSQVNDEIIDRGISLQQKSATEVITPSFNSKNIKKDYTSEKQRALTLAAFMRCIFNAYSYGDFKVRKEIAKILREKRNLLMLTKLCFTADWLTANIGAKYLRLCQLILKLNQDTNFADSSILELDEICCVAVRDILQLMFNRLKNQDKMSFTNKENTLLIELGQVTCILCQQICYLPFYFYENSLKKEKNIITANDPLISFFFNPPKLKQHGIYLMTPQYKCANFTLLQLLPYKSMYTFTLMLFFYSRKIEEIRKSKTISNKVDILKQLDEARAASVYTLAKYMCLCDEERYQFLEDVNKQCIYEGKYLRKSYLQEILTRMQNEILVTAIESFIYVKILEEKGEKERVSYISPCQYCREGESSMTQAMLAITTKAFYFFKPYKRECMKCPLQRACWEPALSANPIPISSIISFIETGISQILVISSQNNSGVLTMFSNSKKQITIIQLNEFIGKKLIETNIRSSFNVEVNIDPIFKEIQMKKFNKSKDIQLVSVSFSLPDSKTHIFSDKPRLTNPKLLIISKGELIFYNLNLKYWKYINYLEEEENSDAMTVNDKKKNEEINVKKKLEQIKKIAGQVVYEDTKLAKNIANVNLMSEKDDKEPIVLLKFKDSPQEQFYITFSCDFGLQSFINNVSPFLLCK